MSYPVSADCFVERDTRTEDEEENMDDKYFIVTSGEDGTSIDGPFAKEELLGRITPSEKEEGGTYYGRKLTFLDHIPSSDKGCWDEFNIDDEERPILIIRGSIVVPKAVKTVTQFDVEESR